MKFTSNSIARKNGYRFDLRGSFWLDGESVPADQQYYLIIDWSGKDPAGHQTIKKHTDTEYTHRFQSADEALAFCEEIVSGKRNMDDLIKETLDFYQQRKQKKESHQTLKCQNFILALQSAGVAPATFFQLQKQYADFDFEEKQMLSELIKSLVIPQEPIPNRATPVWPQNFKTPNPANNHLCILPKGRGT